jgi:hypothetical protein
MPQAMTAADPPQHAAQEGECDAVVVQFAHVPALRDAIQRRDQLQAQLEAAEEGEDYTQALLLGEKLASLQQTIKTLPLSEEDYHTLRDRHAALQKISLECKALLEDESQTALAWVRPVSDATVSSGDRVEQPALASPLYTCNGVPIDIAKEQCSAQTGLGTASARLMVRGEFRTFDGAGTSHTYRCLIKCASQIGEDEPTAKYVDLLRSEHAMYQDLQTRAAAASAQTGCVRCYSLDPAGRYMVLEEFCKDLRGFLNPALDKQYDVVLATITAVQALHSMSIMHGDIKPENVLVHFNDMGRCVAKLCDLECARKAGEICEAAGIGTKRYLAPELRAAVSAKGTLRASLAVDMFALGLVLWQVMKRSPTAALDCDSEARLDQLYSDQAQLNAHLEYPAGYRGFMESVTCLVPLCRPSAAELWGKTRTLSASSAHQNLAHALEENAFLKHAVLENLKTIRNDLESLRRGQEALGKQVNRVLEGNTALNNMVQTLVVGTHGIPTLAVILPEVSNSWADVTQPMRLLRNHFRLYFLCSHTKQIVACGPEGKGYKIEVTKQWVQDAAPVLRVGLVLVKVALLASGLPLPVPDLCSALTDATKHSKYLDAALQLVNRPPDLGDAEYAMQATLDKVEAYGENNLLAEHGVAERAGKLQLEEGSRKAYETIREVLVAQGHNIALTCGLRQVTCGRTGRTAWVLDNDATEKEWMNAAPAADSAPAVTTA